MDELRLEARAKARPIAEKLAADIEDDFAKQAQKAGGQKALVEDIISGMPANEDIGGLVDRLRDATKHPRYFEAIPQIEKAIGVLEGFRQPPSKLLNAAGQPMEAGGRVLVTPSMLNEVRGMLSSKGMAGLGQKDYMVGKQYPLAEAAGEAQARVAEGPLGGVNEQFTEAYQSRKGIRKAAGLDEDLPKRRAADLKRLENIETEIELRGLKKKAKGQQAEAMAREDDLIDLQKARRTLGFGTGAMHSLGGKALTLANIPQIAGRLLYTPAKANLGYYAQKGALSKHSLGLGGFEGNQYGLLLLQQALDEQRQKDAERAAGLRREE